MIHDRRRATHELGAADVAACRADGGLRGDCKGLARGQLDSGGQNVEERVAIAAQAVEDSLPRRRRREEGQDIDIGRHGRDVLLTPGSLFWPGVWSSS